MEKKRCLILFKWPIYLNEFIIKKISKFYDTKHIYMNSFENKNYSQIIKEINSFINREKIEVVFFDVDSIKFLNLFFIERLKNVKKVLMTFDDTSVHEMNAITANACDLVVTHCPFSVLKYREKGYEAHNMFLENDGEVFKNYNLKKDIDVLFFGRVNSNRRRFLDYLSDNKISVKIVGENNNFLNTQELSKTISRSKIVINFSKTTADFVTNYGSQNIYNFYYELKGRVIMAGLCGAYCLSEYSPGQNLLFQEDEIENFKSKEDCLKILNKLLSNEEILKSKTEKFSNKTLNLYEEKKNFEPIYNAIENGKFSKVKLIEIPYWYLRISAKQILKKNISLFKIMNSFSQLGEVWTIIKNSKFYFQILIILESLINIVWYSLLSEIKKKK